MFDFKKFKLFSFSQLGGQVSKIIDPTRLFFNKIWFNALNHPVLFLICIIWAFLCLYAAYTCFQFNLYKFESEREMQRLNLENAKLKENLVVSQTFLEAYELLARFCGKNGNGIECKIIRHYLDSNQAINYLDSNQAINTCKNSKPLSFPTKDPNLAESEKIYGETIRKASGSSSSSFFRTSGAKIDQNFSLKNFTPEHLKEKDFVDRSAKFKKIVEKAIEERKKK